MTQRLAVGIGCRANCSGEAIAALVRRVLEMVADERDPSPASGRRCRPHPPFANAKGTFSRKREKEASHAVRLFTSEAKAAEAGLVEAAAMLGLELVPLARADLEAAAPRCATSSERVERLLGLPSLAEAAALAGAGCNSRLILERISGDGASCAVARAEETAS